MYRLINLGNLNASSKFERQILSYKQIIGFQILFLVNKARTLLGVTLIYFYYLLKFTYLKIYNYDKLVKSALNL